MFSYITLKLYEMNKFGIGFELTKPMPPAKSPKGWPSVPSFSP